MKYEVGDFVILTQSVTKLPLTEYRGKLLHIDAVATQHRRLGGYDIEVSVVPADGTINMVMYFGEVAPATALIRRVYGGGAACLK